MNKLDLIMKLTPSQNFVQLLHLEVDDNDHENERTIDKLGFNRG